MPRAPLTMEIVNERLKGRGIVMLEPYTRQKEKKRFQCDCGHIWMAATNNILFGKGCPKCGNISQGKKKRLSEETVLNRLTSRGIKLIGKYIHSQTIAQFECKKKGHRWETTVNAVMYRTGCPHCYEKNQPLSKEIINARIADREIVLMGEYMGAHISTLFRCGEEHTWKARPNNILQGKNCPHCDGQFPLSKEIVNERLADRGIVLLDEYINNATKRRFRCRDGHIWEAAPANVLAGTGCATCVGNLPLTTEIVNERIAERGIVMLDPFINSTTKGRFKCKVGHVWESKPNNILNGRGCPECAPRTSDYDVLYLWIAGPQQHVELSDGEFLLKFGVSSEFREDLRIKEVAWAWDTTPNVLAIVKTAESALYSEKEVSKIGRRLTSDYSHLDGWTEFRIVSEDEISLLISMAERAAASKIYWNIRAWYSMRELVTSADKMCAHSKANADLNFEYFLFERQAANQYEMRGEGADFRNIKRWVDQIDNFESIKVRAMAEQLTTDALKTTNNPES